MAGTMAHQIMREVMRMQSPHSVTRLAGVRARYNLHGRGWFSTIGEDPDTHNDFKPVNKAPNDIPSAHLLVEKDVKEHPVMLYMKGVPDAPRCGFSALAVKVLQHYGVPFHSRNILEDHELKESIKSFSNWPTFPQVFIKGEFVGGSDIILNMHQSGELKEKLRDLVQDDNSDLGA